MVLRFSRWHLSLALQAGGAGRQPVGQLTSRAGQARPARAWPSGSCQQGSSRLLTRW